MRSPPVLLAVVLLMCWMGCAEGPPLRAGSPASVRLLGDLGRLPAHDSSPLTLTDSREPATRIQTQESLYLEFMAERLKALGARAVPEEDRRRGRESLAEMGVWMHGQTERTLGETTPQKVYMVILLRLQRRDREEAARLLAEEAHQEEFRRWGQQLLAEVANPFHDVGPGYLATDSPLLYASREALVQATLSWAYAHGGDPDFLHKSPSEVALYLLFKDAALRQVVMLGHYANGHLDYNPDLDPTRYTLGEVAVETLVGFIPIVGSIGDAAQSATGISLTGHRLEEGDRVLLAICALVPIVHALKAAHGLEVVAHLAQVTGRSTEEIEALFRVAGHLTTEDAGQLERIVQKAARRERLAKEDLESLERIAGTLRKPLEEVAGIVRAHSGLGLKADLMTGRQLIPGSPEHMYQRWIDYQFRHPGRRGAFSLAIEPQWERMYMQILENAEAGGAFQVEALSSLKLEKNTAMMMPPPGSKDLGFIPDAVKGSPSELIWGQPYTFVEIKGRKDLSMGGNLKAMLDYVAKVENSELTLVVRSAKHPEGATRLTDPLQRELNRLMKQGKVILRGHPQ